MNGSRRLIGIAAVAALHVAIIAALLTLSHQTISAPQAHETFLWFPPPKKIVLPKPGTPRPATPRETRPDYHGITIPDAPPAAPPLGGLNNSLFGCTDLDKLPPEERAHCGSALMQPDDSVDFRDGVNRSQQAALWERGRLRKNGPLLLPCMSTQAAGANLLGTAFCLAKGAMAGEFKPDEQPSYADKLEVTHVPNNGDPPDHPTGF